MELNKKWKVSQIILDMNLIGITTLTLKFRSNKLHIKTLKRHDKKL